MRSTMTAQPGLHSLYKTGSGGAAATLTTGRTGFMLFAIARFTGRLRRPAVRVARVALIGFALTGPSFLHRPVSRLRKRLTSLLPALDNVLVGALVVPRLLAQRREGPRRLRMIALYLAFAAAVRMIHGVHSHAANRRLNTAPACAAGLAEGFVLMVKIAHLADRRHALYGKLANFAGRQLHQSNFTFLAEKLRRGPCGPNHLPAATRIQLQVVHHRAGWNVLELQRIARKDVRAFAGRNRRSHFQAHGMEDVALVAPEVHLAVLLLVSAAAVPDDDFALVVAPA